MENKKSQHGGSRIGSGRKKTGRKKFPQIWFRLFNQTEKDLIDRAAKKAGMTTSFFCRRTILEKIKNHIIS